MRARNLKPGFFTNETLAELPPLTRIFFEGLWCAADREGRMEYRPKKLKAEILPYDRADIPAMVVSLSERGFVTAYQVDDCEYLRVNNFLKHQNPHPRETASNIPELEQGKAKALPSRVKALPSNALSLHSSSLHSESPSPLPALKKEGVCDLPSALKAALAKATNLAPSPSVPFLTQLVAIYGEADLAKQLIECHVWLTGQPEKKPKSQKGCQRRVANWMLQAEKYGKLTSNHVRDHFPAPKALPQGRAQPTEAATKRLLEEREADEREWAALSPEEREQQQQRVKALVGGIGIRIPA